MKAVAFYVYVVILNLHHSYFGSNNADTVLQHSMATVSVTISTTELTSCLLTCADQCSMEHWEWSWDTNSLMDLIMKVWPDSYCNIYCLS